MAFVPGYDHDVFVSYAHGDDREWIQRFASRLESALKTKCGASAALWIDKKTDNLPPTRDFRTHIPDSVANAAIFLFLPSPAYIHSQYCVEVECHGFEETLPLRRTRFTGADFTNEKFALRCPIEQVDDNEHWRLFPGLTDIPFYDAFGIYPLDRPKFERSFNELIQALVPLLKRMRNNSTPVFLYPPKPDPDLAEAHRNLADELTDLNYRVLPDRFVNLDDQLREALLTVFLLGEKYDRAVKALADAARQNGKKWLVWCAPTGQASEVPEQMALLEFLEQLDSPNKSYLNATVPVSKLKEEVRALLNPAPVPVDAGGKRRVYLIYKAGDRTERLNAGRIATSFDEEFDFDHPDDPELHTVRLTRSAGVLLLWGTAEEDWCSREFEAVARSARAKGLCVFDPKENKTSVIEQIRGRVTDVCISEEFGKFERARLEQFFNSIARS